jgi:hypothetical protein
MAGSETIKSRRNRRAETVPQSTDFGHSWLHLRAALTQLGEPTVAAPTLSDAIVTGKIYVFAQRLWKETGSDDGWGDNWVSRKDAEKLGFVTSGLVGPNHRSFALSQHFWHSAGCLSAALAKWEASKDLLLPPVGEEKGPISGSMVSWEIHSPYVPTLQLELLQKLIAVGAYKPPVQNLGGRRRSSKWDAWTARFVEYLQDFGIQTLHDVDLQAEGIAAIIDDKLALGGEEKVDARDARRTIAVVLRHLQESQKT